MTIQLYRFVSADRSGRIAWLLHEMKLDFETVELDARNSEHHEEEFLSLSPAGTIPAVVDGDDVLFESGAALHHLAERYGGGKIAPLADDSDRAAYVSWLYFASASLDPLCFAFVNPILSEEFRQSRREYARRRVGRMLDATERRLDERETVLKRGFTTADIQLTAALDYARAGGCLDDRPRLQHYVETMKARPAARRAEAFTE